MEADLAVPTNGNAHLMPNLGLAEPVGEQPPAQGQQHREERQKQHDDYVPGPDACYICKGRGHWARDCTSLPAAYLVANPPKCYCCHGSGHYARFCPNRTPAVRGRLM